MMSLLDLPLECFRRILESIAESSGLPEFLQLRQVHRVFDSEILRSSEITELFRPCGCLSKFYLTQKPVPSGYIDFVAAFISVKSCPQDPWNTNLSSVVNQVADTILHEDGLELHDISRGKLVRDLCRHIGEIHHWRARPFWAERVMFPTEEFADNCETLEFNVLLAKILLGKCTRLPDLPEKELISRRSIIFSTVTQACIKSGQIALAAELDLDESSIFLAMDTAVECDDLDMLHFLHKTEGWSASGSALKKVALTAALNDRTESALYLLRNWKGETEQLHRTARGMVYITCERGNLALLTAIVDELGLVDLASIIDPSLVSNESSVGIAALAAIGSGHRPVFRFLFDRDIIHERGHHRCLHTLAFYGDVSMAIYIMGECGIRLTQGSWCAFLATALRCATARHVRLVETLINEPHLFDGKKAKLSDPPVMESGPLEPDKLFKESIRLGHHGDLFFEAIVHGNLLVVKKLAENGADLDILRRSDEAVMSPVLAALSAGQAAVAETLVKLGAKPVDPKESPLKEKFGNGKLPRVFPTRSVHKLDCLKSRC